MEASPLLFLAKLAKPRPLDMQVNMLAAKSQLSRLVKAALAGEEVIIASHGKAQVRLVPCRSAAGLKQPGALTAASPDLVPAQVDAAFAELIARARVEGLMAVSSDAHWPGYDVSLHRVIAR